MSINLNDLDEHQQMEDWLALRSSFALYDFIKINLYSKLITS